MSKLDKFEQAVKSCCEKHKLSTKTTQELDDRIMNNAIAACKQNSPELQANVRRRIMTSKFTKYAAAAVILLALILTLNHNGVAPDGATLAWADIIDNLGKIKSFIYNETRYDYSDNNSTGYELRGDDKYETKYLSLEYGIRTDSHYQDELSRQTFELTTTNQNYFIDHSMHEYNVTDNYSIPSTTENLFEPGFFIKLFCSNEYEQLGESEIDGVTVEGIRVNSALKPLVNFSATTEFEATLWVEVSTQLPYLIEANYRMPDTKGVCLIISDFQWDVELTEELFTPKIPDHYSPTESEQHTANRNELLAEKPETLDISYLDIIGLSDAETDNIEYNSIQSLDGMQAIWAEQKHITRQWPDYSKVCDLLKKELQEKLDYEKLTLDEILDFASLLRDKFWAVGGRLSTKSYRYGYMAYILNEYAFSIAQDDMVTIDAFVESLQTILIMDKYMALNSPIKPLRQMQFDKIKNEIANGRKPEWQDFLYSHDLVELLGYSDDFDKIIEIIQWQIYNAQAGGWDSYLEPIKKSLELAKNKDTFSYNIVISNKPGFPEEFRFSNTLESFKGPSWRVTIPLHKLSNNPKWTK